MKLPNITISIAITASTLLGIYLGYTDFRRDSIHATPITQIETLTIEQQVSFLQRYIKSDFIYADNFTVRSIEHTQTEGTAFEPPSRLKQAILRLITLMAHQSTHIPPETLEPDWTNTQIGHISSYGFTLSGSGFLRPIEPDHKQLILNPTKPKIIPWTAYVTFQ